MTLEILLISIGFLLLAIVGEVVINSMFDKYRHIGFPILITGSIMTINYVYRIRKLISSNSNELVKKENQKENTKEDMGKLTPI
jgi:hypothetical protein